MLVWVEILRCMRRSMVLCKYLKKVTVSTRMLYRHRTNSQRKACWITDTPIQLCGNSKAPKEYYWFKMYLNYRKHKNGSVQHLSLTRPLVSRLTASLLDREQNLESTTTALRQLKSNSSISVLLESSTAAALHKQKLRRPNRQIKMSLLQETTPSPSGFPLASRLF